MISCSNIQFSYPGGTSFQFPDFLCKQGERLLILGNSGKGKTTLLHLIAGMLQAKSGTVQIADQDVSKLSRQELDKFRGDNVGIIFQTAHFIESLSVIDNLIMPHYLTGTTIDRALAQEHLDRLNIGSKAFQKPSDLSIGEQQRVAIARAIMNKPKVILADEPTSALDDHNTNEVIQLLEQQADLTGASLVIVTHDQRLKDHFTKSIEL